MSQHHGTLRLLLKLLAVVLVGVAVYVLIVYGLARSIALIPIPIPPSATSTTSIATSTQVIATTTTVSSTSTPSWEKGMQIVTSSDNNTTVSLKLNERFVIQLGGGLNWTLTFTPADGITRVPNTTTANGIQGIYEADKAGTTVLHATGAPICKAGQACPMFLAVSTVTFIVK